MAFTVMHPQAARCIAEERAAELREVCATGRLARHSRRQRVRCIRQRAGWALITLGLRLAVSPEPPPAQ